ncbi:MAG: hypothetical protein MSA01_05935 [Anaeromassilibacillus sp.]|nr:hypothetical protein [Anaeromassilibacillus sp.]MDY3778637.1 hypothetical protein [Candidatus Limousia pullorum]
MIYLGSTNKTEYLGLSGWVHSDTPKMIDFATDNEIVDSILGEHINDSKIHLSEEDRALLGGSITSTLMAGNGSTSRTVTLSSAPKMVQIFLKNAPPASWNSEKSCMVVNSAFVLQKGMSTGGASLNDKSLVLTNSSAPSNGIMYNLNEEYGQYVIICYS